MATQNALVIMGDSLSNKEDLFLEQKSGYVARYRDVNRYKSVLMSNGMHVLAEIRVMDAFAGKVQNNLYLLVKI